MKPLQEIDIYQVRKELFRRSYFEFFKHYWNVLESKDLIPSPHIEYIANELQKAIERVASKQHKEYDIVINIPPAMSKSTLVTVLLPAWIWAYFPEMKIISTSYSYSLSVSHSIKSRDVILSDEYQATYNLQLKEDKSGKQEYANTQKGERIATSIGGTITGKHADIIIIDDPINPKKASSQIERENANNYIKNTLNTRKTDANISLTILVMQRLHSDDVSGLFLEREKIKHICLPAEYNDNIKPEEAKAIYSNGLLDPIRLSNNILDEIKQNIGSYAYAGQYQQQPAPDGGGIWKQEWFKIVPDNDFPTNLSFYGTDWDLAYTKNEQNSASAYIVAGKISNDIYIDFIGCEWLEFPDLINLMKSKPAPHYIENKACFTGETLVKTRNGYKEIKNIKKGDFVLSFKGNKERFKKVIDTHVFGSFTHKQNIVIIKLANGTIIRCTDNHEFYIKGNWVAARDVAKRALELGAKYEPALRCVNNGQGLNHEIQDSSRIQHFKAKHTKASKRFQWIFKSRIDNKWETKNSKSASLSGTGFYSKQTSKASSKSHKFHKGRQQIRKFRVGNSIRKSKTFCFYGVKRWIQKWTQTQKQCKGFKNTLFCIDRKNGERDKRKVQAQKIHQENVGQRIWGKLSHHCLRHKYRLEAREIIFEEINSVFVAEIKEPVFDLTIEDFHTYCVTEENIKVHNSGKSAKQTLTQQGINAIETEVAGGGDKIARARMATPIAESGRVYIRESQADRLFNDSKQGLKYFPNGSNDDVADALSQCLMRLGKTYNPIII